MKRLILPLCLMMVYTTIFCATAADPELVVVIMVKNEEDVLIKTLQPFFDAGIHSFLVFDTLSNDNTVRVAQEFFDAHPDINGYIFQEPFIDFAASRNRALDLARETFPTGGYIIMPDAEWYIENAKELLLFCQDEIRNNAQTPVYLVRLLFGNIDFYQPRLIRIASDVYFEGEIHESIYSDALVPETIYFLVQPTTQGYEKSKKRWERDLQILLKKHNENPWDARTLFYLAQTYDCLQDWHNAYKYYALRTQIDSWKEENFMAHYRLAQVLEYHLDDWDRAFAHYLKAFAICPQRAEPLIKISQHYWHEGNVPTSYLFSQYALQLNYPDNDRLFIDKEIYDFTRYEMVGITAWHMGKFDVGKAAAQKAYEQRPHLEYLKRNVECYG